MKQIFKLPTPSSISFNWNFGSLLGLSLGVQVMTGIFMTMYYSPTLSGSFNSVVYLMNNVNYGWLVRTFHANGATFFFFLIYVHIARAMYYKSFLKSSFTWMSGVTMYLLYMAAAFLGYVLPWGQMSYWGATVITNLISAIPYVGGALVEWVWGGFSVSSPTLTRFFSLHYLIPLLSVIVVFLHLFFLHETGSSNPVGISKNSDKISFHPFFTVKDFIGFLFFLVALFFFSLQLPTFFLDSDNFMIANPMVTPVHIQPEWYFLFAYAILRSVPNKLGGVVSLVMSIFCLYLFPFFSKKKNSFFYKVFCVLFYFNFALLTYVGAMAVEFPFYFLGLFSSFFYFLLISVLLYF